LHNLKIDGKSSIPLIYEPKNNEMKKILLYLIFLPAFCFSQNCDTLLQTSKDKFTDEVFAQFKHPVLIVNKNKEKCYMDIIYSNRNLIVSVTIKSNTFKCTDDKVGMVFFVADNGEKMQVYNETSFNCDGQSFLYIKGHLENVKFGQYLRTQLLSAIRISGINSSAEFDISKKNAEKIKSGAICLLEKY
jgi:hypothetical protein